MNTTIIKRKKPLVALKMAYHNLPYHCISAVIDYYAYCATEEEDVDNPPVLIDELNIKLADENITLIIRIYQENDAFEDSDCYLDLRQNVDNIFNALLLFDKYNNYSESEKDRIYEKYRTSEEVKYIINKKMRELCKDYDINPNKIIVFIH